MVVIMKNKIKIVSIVISLSAFSVALLISVFFLFVSCQKQKAEWKGTIEEENGVIVVKNPKEPMYDDVVFSLEEELSIGEKEGGEKYMFNRIVIDVDDDGNLYILDNIAIEIRVFDKYGNYLYSIGQKGQGPGEMQRPSLPPFQITPQNEILVSDPPTRRIIFYSLQGDYLRQISTASIRGIFYLLKIDSKGNFIVELLYAPVFEIKQELKMFDSELSPIVSLKTLKGEPHQPGVIRLFGPSISFILTQDNKIIWGTSNKYEFYILNSNAKVIKMIYKDYDRVEIPEKYKERIKERYRRAGRKVKIHFPKHFPAFNDMYIDDEGRLFVQTYERVKDKEQYYYFDVFDPIGKYIAKIPIKAGRTRQYIWKKNKLYTVEVDEEGYPFIKRYKVIWEI